MTTRIRNILLVLLIFLTWAPELNANPIVSEDNVYQRTVRRWRTALVKAKFRQTTYIQRFSAAGGTDRRHSNGGRDTVIMIPDNVDLSEEVNVLFWFHGLNGFSSRTFEKRLMPQLNYLASIRSNYIIVIPEMPWSTNTTTPRGRQGKVWTGRHGDNFNKFYKDVIKTIESHFLHPDYEANIEYRNIIVGHSAGGSAISSLAKSGQITEVNIDMIVFSDASYGRWLENTWRYHVSGSDTALCVYVRDGDTPHDMLKRFLRDYRAASDDINIKVLRRSIQHHMIGDRILQICPIFDGC